MSAGSRQFARWVLLVELKDMLQICWKVSAGLVERTARSRLWNADSMTILSVRSGECDWRFDSQISQGTVWNLESGSSTAVGGVWWIQWGVIFRKRYFLWLRLRVCYSLCCVSDFQRRNNFMSLWLFGSWPVQTHGELIVLFIDTTYIFISSLWTQISCLSTHFSGCCE